MKRILKDLIILVLLLLLVGCTKKPELQDTPTQMDQTASDAHKQDVSDGEGMEPKTGEIIQQAAWCVYWDPASASAAVENYTRYKEMVLFGCVYAEDYTLSVPDRLTELISKLPDREYSNRPELYLSFINDVIHPDGSSTQKSTAFLQEVLTDAELSDTMIDDMIRMTKAFGFDGIELDYENIHKCDDLWNEYLFFLSRLWQRSFSENLKLRVILPVSTPVDNLAFVEGPRYIVMCYNLYGYHSGPGPKADENFLKNTVNKFKSLGVDYAVANGGFEWGPNEEVVRALTAEAAAALATETGAREMRDSDGVIHYTFQSEDGLHTVFYGDEETIQRWSEILLEKADGDIRVDLWRLE